MTQDGEERDVAGVAALLDDLRRALLRQADGSGPARPAENRSTSSWSPEATGAIAAVVLAGRQLAPGALVHHMHPVGDVAGMRPGWPSATGSGPRVILLVSTVRTPFSTVCANRSRLRGAGPSSLTLVPRRS